jgi:truncated hemoglobin YjbI
MLYRLFYNTFAKYPEHFNQPLTEVASGPQFTTGEFGSLLSSHRG